MRMMMNVLGGIVGFAIFAVGIWLLFVPSRSAKPKSRSQPDAQTARKISFMTGLRGGSVEDAATAAFALSRVEQDSGKPSSDLEIATAVTLAAYGKSSPK
jgi:hypothetical protein